MFAFKKFLLETTEEDFTRAIESDPADTSNLLIFADWLEERGDYEKAEILRILVSIKEGHATSQTFEQLRQISPGHLPGGSSVSRIIRKMPFLNRWFFANINVELQAIRGQVMPMGQWWYEDTRNLDNNAFTVTNSIKKIKNQHATSYIFKDGSQFIVYAFGKAWKNKEGFVMARRIT